eukprot:GDKH01019649.1.p1 GENE.GDKH01019649.1~~GDKH01019649.1.p1  ORF type:complete len:69 (-),score=7.99 GDKH01019649.1:86-292(-)
MDSADDCAFAGEQKLGEHQHRCDAINEEIEKFRRPADNHAKRDLTGIVDCASRVLACVAFQTRGGGGR